MSTPTSSPTAWLGAFRPPLSYVRGSDRSRERKRAVLHKMPVILTLSCSRDETGLLAAELDDSAMLGLIEEDLDGGRSLLRAFFEDPMRAAAIAERLPAYNPVIGPYEARDWVAMARSQWNPVLAGDRFFLVPPWCDDPAPSGSLTRAVTMIGWPPAGKTGACCTAVIPGGALAT